MGNSYSKTEKTEHFSDYCTCKSDSYVEKGNETWFNIPDTLKRVLIYSQDKGEVCFETSHINSLRDCTIYQGINTFCLCDFPIKYNNPFYLKVAGNPFFHGSALTQVKTSRKETCFFINYNLDGVGGNYHCLSLLELSKLSLYQHQLESAFDFIGTILPFSFKNCEIDVIKQFLLLDFCINSNRFRNYSFRRGCLEREHCVHFDNQKQIFRLSPLWKSIED
jgi:hypothetical protein